MAADDINSSEYETSGVSGSTESLDLSCIHWGYLNCTLVTDPKRIKENVWQTYWVDLCGSTIRLYRDLSLPPNSACQLPPSSLIGPSNENEKKEAFIVLKKGAEVEIVEPEIEPYKSRKKLRVNKRHAFKVSFASKGNSHPTYVFQAPSKGSMYRWISKIEEGIDMADKPQNESATEKKLKEAKLFSMEQRRFNMAPKLRYLDKDDVDSGMEGDVEEIDELSKKTSEELRLEDLRKRLQEKEQLVRQLDLEERAFLGPENSNLVKRCEFKSKTNKDYYLLPGYKRTLLPRGSEVTVLGQLSNNWWRCFVELRQNTSTGFSNGCHSETSSLAESTSSIYISDDNSSGIRPEKETLIGSVPTSLLVELRLSTTTKLPMKDDDGTPMGSPEETPLPSPPLSPYSPHKSDGDSLPNRSSLRRSIVSENQSQHDVWEQFCIPSPPSSPATSRSTSPSLTPSASPAGSLEALDFRGDTATETSRRDVEKSDGFSRVKLRSNRRKNRGRNDLSTKSNREAILMDDTFETCSEPELNDDRLVTVIDAVPPDEMPSVLQEITQETVKTRVKPRLSPEGATTGELPRNYAFLVTKKLRQRGISLIVGSSSSEDEDEDGEGTRVSSKISRRKLDTEFMRFEGEQTAQEVRPYSAFVSRKQPGITLHARSSIFVPRTSTKDELLRDYSSSTQKTPLVRTNTCTTIKKLADWSSPENVPPINQRRTLQMSKASSEGFGFTLQTYGITQMEGQVEYMTFVLTVQEDGPAYMAGLRPGDIILEVDGKNVEDADHKDVVSLIQQGTLSVRLVVVFVDALRRMKLNTRLKILTAELNDKNAEFSELCKKEEELLQGRGGSLNLSPVELVPNHERRGSHLYTTELTTSFARESPEVHDSLLKYRQTGHDKPRPTSLPDQSELNQRCIVATTGSEILRSFASADMSIQRRSLSTKLIRTFSKKRKSVESFKSYLDSDAVDREKADETGSDTSSLSSTSGVCESPVTAAEPTVAISTAVEGKTVIRDPSLAQASPVNVSVAFNPDEVTDGPKDSSPMLRLGLDNSDLTGGKRVSPGVGLMHRRMEKSVTAKGPPSMPVKEKLKESSLSSQALIGPQLRKARSSSRPDSYLLAMDAAGEQPLIPNQERNKNANMILYESGT